MLYLLDDSPPDTPFPDPADAESDPNGLLAIGGDLTSQRLLQAYRRGIFPWFSEGQPILWWSPDPRMVLQPTHLRISRSLRKTLRQGHFTVSMDQVFAQVIRACAGPRRDGNGTWLLPEMIEAYTQLHRQGIAHSVETWHEGKLVGGLYGVSLGRMFFGESMFSRMRDASKAALILLACQLRHWQFDLIDCQVYTEHLASLGAEEIPRPDFQAHLKQSLALPAPGADAWNTPPFDAALLLENR